MIFEKYHMVGTAPIYACGDKLYRDMFVAQYTGKDYGETQ